MLSIALIREVVRSYLTIDRLGGEKVFWGCRRSVPGIRRRGAEDPG